MEVRYEKTKNSGLAFEELPTGCIFRAAGGGAAVPLLMKSAGGLYVVCLTGSCAGEVTLNRAWGALGYRYEIVDAHLVVTSSTLEGER